MELTGPELRCCLPVQQYISLQTATTHPHPTHLTIPIRAIALPTDLECAQFTEELRFRPAEVDRLVRERFPIVEHRTHYWRWVHRRSQAQRKPLPNLPAKTLARRLQDTNFFNPDDRKALDHILASSRLPPIPLGHNAHGTNYRLVGCDEQLLPHDNGRLNLIESDRLLDPGAILYLRTRNDEQVPRLAHRPGDLYTAFQRESSVHSTITINSDSDSGYCTGSSSSGSSDGGTNFIFHQLGTIESLPAKHDPANNKGWEPTGFVLVFRLRNNGCAVPYGLYAILDLFPVADVVLDTEARVETPMPNRKREYSCRELVGELRPSLATESLAFSVKRLTSVPELECCDEQFKTLLIWSEEFRGAIDLLPVEMRDEIL